MRRIISLLVLLGLIGIPATEAMAWKCRLLKKMTKPPLINKECKRDRCPEK